MTMPFRGLLAELAKHWVALIGLAAVAALVISVDPSKVEYSLRRADMGEVALMLPVVVALYALHGVAWSIALRGLRLPIGVRRAIKVTLISQAFDLVPGGDLWRVPILKAESGSALEAGVLTAAVVFDDLVYFLVLTLGMVPAAVEVPWFRAALGAALLPQAAIFAILLWPGLYERLAQVVGSIRLFRRFQVQIDLLGPAFRRLVRARTVIPIVLVDALCAGLAIALFGLALAAVHATGASPERVSFTYASGQVLTGLTVLPGALGLYEGMMTGMMAVQGVAVAAAAAAALIYRLINDVLMAILGLGVALVFDRRPMKYFGRRPEVAAP
ncbi:MAG TPA: lysylphosphatidylglycerol synthase transmembrane domain-containing protein [Candidatus Acidoferrales bacterium]|nr:lysylphosphatidylglycerol synthase transmembrane domain-containing protein [Candidatus Acidoferrales bacterium]